MLTGCDEESINSHRCRRLSVKSFAPMNPRGRVYIFVYVGIYILSLALGESLSMMRNDAKPVVRHFTNERRRSCLDLIPCLFNNTL